MLDRKVIKDFLIEEFEDFNPIPNDIDLDKLTEDFSIYTENDFYEWLKDNFKSYFFQRGDFDWSDVKGRLTNNSPELL
ncbi:MAG: hypothetical protein KJ666_13855 [Bacteroidetes bacterium]|nr:hypothetical protein [Bacteroidota bacterium]MBU2586107.1 hypothetical protein [Bacteroidota bacterium]